MEEPHKSFFQEALDMLQFEFNLYTEITDDTDVLEYHERAMVGFFNNAIIRNSSNNFVSLQEYVVRNNIGRADLLICDKKNETYYLFEAKHKPDYPANDLINWINSSSTQAFETIIEKQLRKYYQEEKGFFEKKTTYLCVIYFEFITGISENFDKIQGNLLDAKLINSFYTLYHHDDLSRIGLAVYGIIRKQ
jgi:hypothetical protein